MIKIVKNAWRNNKSKDNILSTKIKIIKTIKHKITWVNGKKNVNCFPILTVGMRLKNSNEEAKESKVPITFKAIKQLENSIKP